MKNIFSILLLIIVFPACDSGETGKVALTSNHEFFFQNPTLDMDTRVDDLISRMTIEEKVLQLFHGAPAIERLGVPAYNWWNECLHGVARAGKATVFPQAIGLAATFDEDLMFRMATATSDEARAKHHNFLRNGVRSIYTGLTFWSPNINIFRDPRWGRGQETYGEDPYLTGRMAVNFINGLQGDDPKYLKSVATAKHYAVHNGPEHTRHIDNFYVNDRDLYTTYLPAYKAAVMEANVQSIMCAYNRFRDKPCCGSDLLLSNILRNEFGFEGYVVSDCGAITDFYALGHHNIVDRPAQAWGWSLASGTDLNCETSRAFIEDNILEAIESGIVNEADINQSLKRLFTARFKLGMFDPEEMVPYAAIPMSKVGSEEHLKLALEAAEKSLVLLKNDGLLPLKDVKKIALIGPNADNYDILIGNYNGLPINPKTPLDGLVDRLGEENVLYAAGSPLVPGIYGNMTPVPPGELFHIENGSHISGLNAVYYRDTEFNGLPDLERIDANVDFLWEKTPISNLPEESFGARWTGILVPSKPGRYIFGGNVVVKINGKIAGDQPVSLEMAKNYELLVEYVITPFWHSNAITPWAKMTWVEVSKNYEKEAIDAANAADVVVFCGGISSRLEGEEMPLEIDGFSHGDRTNIKLPSVQEELLKKLKDTGKPVVYVNFSGSAIALNWEDENLPAVIQAFYPGEQTGTALARLLFGDFSPSGKLPVTFYKSVNDLPPFKNYEMKNRTYRYFEGTPLYPFGYGLSYSTFNYDQPQFMEEIKAGEALGIAVRVTNSGNMDSNQAVQLYLSDVEASVPIPSQSLVAFKNIHLKAGESKTVEFLIKPEQMAVINSDYKAEIEEGEFEWRICGSTGDNQSEVKGRFRISGNHIVR